jgi:hypothetical protein
MGRLANTPSWGVLVQAPIEPVREILASFADHLVLRTNAGWTAAFYMDIVDTADDEAAEGLRAHGYVPVYRFDFSKYQFLTWRWDGQRWDLLERNDNFVDPDRILSDVGLQAPYWDEPEPQIKVEPLEVREAVVVEGASVDQTRAIIGDRWRIEPGPRGAIVYGPEGLHRDRRTGIAFNDARFGLWDHAPQRVLEVEFYPKSESFWFRIMKGEECLGTFRPEETRTRDGTPFLASVEGETQPEAIVEKFGIPRSFLARS